MTAAVGPDRSVGQSGEAAPAAATQIGFKDTDGTLQLVSAAKPFPVTGGSGGGGGGTSANVGVVGAAAPSSANQIGVVDANGNLQPISSAKGLPIVDGFQAPVSVSWNAATAVNTAETVVTSGYDTVIVTSVAAGTITAGHITFEVFDGVNWLAIKAPRIESYQTEGGYALSGGNRAWQVPIAGFPEFRVRLDTAITGSGSVSITTIISSAPDTSLVTAGLDPNQPLPAGANTLGAVTAPGAAALALDASIQTLISALRSQSLTMLGVQMTDQTVADGNIASGGDTSLYIQPAGASTVQVSISGTLTAGQINFVRINDYGLSEPAYGYPNWQGPGVTAIQANGSNLSGSWDIDAAGSKQIGITLSGSTITGTAAVTLRATNASRRDPLQQSTAKPFLKQTLTNTAFLAKTGGPGIVLWFVLYNPNTYPVFLQWCDSSSPTPGSTTPTYEFVIEAGVTRPFMFPPGAGLIFQYAANCFVATAAGGGTAPASTCILSGVVV